MAEHAEMHSNTMFLKLQKFKKFHTTYISIAFLKNSPFVNGFSKLIHQFIVHMTKLKFFSKSAIYNIYTYLNYCRCTQTGI